MIQLKQLVSQLEERLNNRLIAIESAEEIAEPYIAFKNNNFSYRFRLILNTADYQRSQFINGKEIRYINCEVNKIGNDVEGVDLTTISIDTSLEFLIPIINSTPELEDNLEILNAVDYLITEMFSKNAYAVIKDEENGLLYTYATRYTLLSTGMRMQRAGVGDSITMSATLEYFFIPYGVNSADVFLSIDGELVKYIHLGRNRQAIQENGISSETESGEVENINIGSTYAISFDLPTRMSQADNGTLLGVSRILNDYLDGEEDVAHLVKITRPISVDVDTLEVTTRENNKLMVFSSVNDNYETVLNGSTSVTMVSAMYGNNRLSTLSDYAETHWGN
jgi:hypothetical protein